MVKTKAVLSKNFHIQPSELDAMPMWEYEMYLNCLNELVKEDNDQQQAEMDKHNISDYQKMANPKNVAKMTQPPKMPSMPSSIKLPK